MAETGGGYGQYEPNDSGDQFNLNSFMIKQALTRLVTCKIVKVVAVHPGQGSPAPTGTVDVQPLVNQIDGNGQAVAHGTIYGVPVVRLQGGKNGVIAEPAAGDVGVAVAMDRDTSTVKETWKAANPGSRRTYNAADLFYVGGGFGLTPEQYVLFNDDGCQIVDKSGNTVVLNAAGFALTDPTGNVLKGTSAGITATPKVGLPFTVNGNFVLNGNFQISGTIEAVDGTTYAGDFKLAGNVIAGFGTGDQVSLQNHTHQYDRPTGTSSPAQTVKPTAGT